MDAIWLQTQIRHHCNPPSSFGIVDCLLQAYITVTMMVVEVDGGIV
jgi:hypothetical protein